MCMCVCMCICMRMCVCARMCVCVCTCAHSTMHTHLRGLVQQVAGVVAALDTESTERCRHAAFDQLLLGLVASMVHQSRGTALARERSERVRGVACLRGRCSQPTVQAAAATGSGATASAVRLSAAQRRGHRFRKRRGYCLGCYRPCQLRLCLGVWHRLRLRARARLQLRLRPRLVMRRGLAKHQLAASLPQPRVERRERCAQPCLGSAARRPPTTAPWPDEGGHHEARGAVAASGGVERRVVGAAQVERAVPDQGGACAVRTQNATTAHATATAHARRAAGRLVAAAASASRRRRLGLG